MASVINATTTLTGNEFFDFDCSDGISSVFVEITGLSSGQLLLDGTTDGVNYFDIYQMDYNLQDGQIQLQFAYDGVFTIATGGLKGIRFTAAAISSTPTLRISGTQAASMIHGIENVVFTAITGNLPLPDGAATEATLAAINAKLVSGTDIGDVTVNNAAGVGAVNIQDGGNSITIDGTVTVTQATGTNLHAVLDANSGVDIGDVTVNNGAGAAAVNIQDGGNSITVDGTVAVSNFPAYDTNYGTVGANTLRGAAQIGNATGAALFGAGTTTAQVLRVVLPTDQTVIPVQGQKTNNNAAPGATNIGTLPAVANAAIQTRIEGNQVSLSTDLGGRQRVLNTPTTGILQTYSASASNLLSVASATDIFTITGSATKTILITLITISGTATSATVASIDLVKRSTADTGGTSQNLTEVSSDSTNAAATATTLSYTANPTLGSTVGTVRSFKCFLPPPTGGNANTPSSPITFPHTFAQPITLRGTGEVIAFNLKGVTITGGSFNISVEWVEI